MRPCAWRSRAAVIASFELPGCFAMSESGHGSDVQRVQTTATYDPDGDCIEDSKKKLAYDLYYVKNNDTLLDIAILLQTARVVISGQGGH